MVKIALNQHGTRALQKMIEFISTREQVRALLEELLLALTDYFVRYKPSFMHCKTAW